LAEDEFKSNFMLRFWI